MSQHDMNIASGSGAAVRADINLALAAIASLHTGPVGSLPAAFANMLVADTTSGHIAKRNHGNTDWDYLMPIDQRVLTSTAGSNAYAITKSPAMGSYKNGVMYQFRADVANTGSASLNINSLGAVTIKRYKNGALVALVANEILANQVCECLYDSTASAMILLNPMQSTSKIVQVVNVKDGAYAYGSTVMPFDNTIPQQTEGDQYLSLAITPSAANSKLRIEAVLNLAASTLSAITVALFRDAGANALCCLSQTLGANGIARLCLDFYTDASAVVATTFKIRVGLNVGGYTYFNGLAGSVFGGTLISSLTITEIAA